ncbi:glycosyltransferase [Beijerinckia indica]|uniref:Glycosyl transferase group 1 n=1 Tax=Beijerinckia indica subsp. indica (strain ATCC 9039 / DSM 1715 / NCIMB 8712) TaxID=395963 RepID=B2ILM3_BEII9|nr:glycosyltransferase [Beijerinckia indica]ACB97423.1 glycosyl transferase group 1 [Beijerinckia indica subsp. indica ATCC 9039]
MAQNPTFAFVTIGSGSYLGSTIRDLTLAHSLYKRGFKVVIYWMLEHNPDLVINGIEQRILCYGTRYQFKQPSEFLDRIVGPLLSFFPKGWRTNIVQNIPGFVDRLLQNLMRSLYTESDPDPSLVKRLLKYVELDGVTHLMMSFGSISPLALEVKKLCKVPLDYLVTFQGDEQFADFAAKAGLLQNYRRRLDEAVRNSGWPAIAISRDYLQRLVTELGLDPNCFRVIYNGIDLPKQEQRLPFSILKTAFPKVRQDDAQDGAIVTFIGRQESEKGIDLLLYAAKLLAVRGVHLQLVICGSTAKGRSYQKVINDLTSHLKLVINHSGAVSFEVRDALYAHSRCIVYPSVDREAFGLVVAEAMSQGTPVLVPDIGGVTEVIQHGNIAGGLTFKTWDSADLARQLERLLKDDDLHAELAANTRALAARFSAEHMANNILEHLNLSLNRRFGEEYGSTSRVRAS